jgi:2-(1,2-epoxy-1,2-dihydrophenyl)acetyl-CoA isomerase
MTESRNPETEAAILYEKQAGVATLTLNRPKTRNALTAAMFVDMEPILIEIAADDEVRVLVLTGAGRGFSSGADLMPVSKEERRRTETPSFPGDPGGNILERGNRCILRLRELRKPVLGSINGDAVGAGCSLALATDLRIASESARFGVVFSRIGVSPDAGATHFLPNLVGPAKALELLFLGELMDASEALRLGLVNRVVGADELAGATSELAERLAQGPTLAYGFAKQAVYQGANLPFESLLDFEARNQQLAFRSQDAREGIRAFRERRKPDFRGR